MGRSSIYLVIGFSAIMLFTGKNLSNVGVVALDNSLSYYENTNRYAIALPQQISSVQKYGNLRLIRHPIQMSITTAERSAHRSRISEAA